ncbi:hypothetical protein AVEN_26342-1 [Araneus ventricosus]|uniref:Uncharacterized protein n=1 Tax=Araneus ventricosus TaxID=182803 RepID=A0A4Y2AMC9_ARAVE|nr:hypothetical protein AVEN_26342-1 [Araneus ventricosus]
MRSVSNTGNVTCHLMAITGLITDPSRRKCVPSSEIEPKQPHLQGSIGGQLKNDRHNSSNAEFGVLIAISGHGPSEGGTFRHRSGVSQPTPLLYPPGKREPLTYARLLIHVLVLSSGGGHNSCNLNRVTHVLLLEQGTLNDSRCNSSITEAGVVLAITGHCPSPPVGGKYYHWKGVTRPPPLLYSQEKRDSAYLSCSFSSTNWWCHPGGVIINVKKLLSKRGIELHASC